MRELISTMSGLAKEGALKVKVVAANALNTSSFTGVSIFVSVFINTPSVSKVVVSTFIPIIGKFRAKSRTCYEFLDLKISSYFKGL